MSGNKGPARQSSPDPPPVPNRAISPIIQFIDSQDPNTKSAIQRHTAHYAAAMRREARLQAIRVSRPRSLEWQTQSSAETISVPTPAINVAESSSAASPDIDLPNERWGVHLGPLAQSSAPEAAEQSGFRCKDCTEGLMKKLSSLQYPFDCRYKRDTNFNQQVKTRIFADHASAHLTLSYCLALRGGTSSNEVLHQRDLQHSTEHRNRGQNTIMLRLQDLYQASSDSNIQAVLILIALVSDFGDRDERIIHINGLNDMVRQRGGLDSLRHDTCLQFQVRLVGTARQHHLTLACGDECPKPFRIPQQHGQERAA